LLQVSHGALVELRFSLPESQSAQFLALANEQSQGHIQWL